MRRAFTLIEILISASILGLGVLGIATLFAGAARQQQIASEQTDAERVARNIDALLESRFDRFAGIAFDPDPGVNGPFFVKDQWHPIASVPFGGVTNRPRGILSVDISDNGLRDQSVFGLTDLGEVVLFSLNGAVLNEDWDDSFDPPTAFWGSGSSTIVGGEGAEITDTTLLDIAGVQRLGFLQVIPGTVVQPNLELEVEIFQERIVDDFGVLRSDGLLESDVQTFEFLNPQDVREVAANADHWPFDPGAARVDRIELVDPSDADPMTHRLDPDDSYIDLQYKALDTNEPPYVYISDLSINMPDNADIGEPGRGARHIIGRITARGVETRDDRLLAFDERIAYTSDDAYPDNRRPTNGVALLMQRGEFGERVLVVAYTIEALGRVDFDPDADEVAFVPPDTFERLYDTSDSVDQYGLFSQVELELSYDDALQQYIVEADTNEEWAIQPGQILIVCSRNRRVDPLSGDRGSAPDPGASAPVRIRTTRRGVSGLEGVLEDSPRVSAESMLESFNDTQTIYAWAMRDVVRSENGGDQSVDWRVRPTGARIITFGGN